MAYLTNKGRTYYCVFYANGKHRWHRLGKFPRVADAKIKYEEYLKSSDNASKGDIIFTDIAKQYLNFVKTTKSIRTHQLESDIYRLVNKTMGHITLSDITPTVIEQFLASIKFNKNGKEKKPNTIRIYLTFISSVLKYAKAHGYNSADPFTTVRIPHIPQHAYETRALPLDTFNAIISALPPVHKQTACIMKYTICRPFEAFSLAPEDVDLDNMILRISSAKNSNRKRPRNIPISKNLLPYLKDLPIKTTQKAFFLALKKACNKVGADPKKLTPYVFRHSSATIYLELTNDLRGLAELMGHSRIETTARYARTLEAKLRANMNAIP